MVFFNVLEVTNLLYLGSPLDQFGDDSDDVLGIVDYSILDTIPGIVFLDEIFDWSALNEVDSLSDWVALALGNAGVFVFDDEDSDSS